MGDIQTLQQKLIQLNITVVGTPDGKFGKNTTRAIQIFKKEYDRSKACDDTLAHYNGHGLNWKQEETEDSTVERNCIMALDEAIVSGWKYEPKCYCNRDFTVDEVKNIVKALRKTENINSTSLWIPVYSSGISPSDKSYETTTKELNRIMNKYNINTCLRKIHFLAQTYHETDRFRAMTEYNSKYTSRYDPYRGRGLVHLTWNKTYKKFANYLSDDLIYTNPSILATNINYAFEAGGWYWENIGKVTATNENINLVADTDNTLKVSQCINGRVSNPNGLDKRIKYVESLKGIMNYVKKH